LLVKFNKPATFREALSDIEICLNSAQTGGGGPYTAQCERLLENLYGAPVLLVHSATAALEMSAMLIDIKPGDEVIIPAYTFVSTANAFALRGAKIRFADIDQFGNLSVDEVFRLRSDRTRAVIAVHYGGSSADMHKLAAACRELNVDLIEDAAQSICSTSNGIQLGTFGRLACVSFHETKNISCGEGGGLIVNDRRLWERARIIRDKGTNRAEFIDGKIDKYTWVDIGSSYPPSELNAALLLSQLRRAEEITRKRKQLWSRYECELSGKVESRGCRVLAAPEHAISNGHCFAIIMASNGMRSEFIAYMKSRAISVAFHYVPLHSSPYGKRFHTNDDPSLPNAERFGACLVRLPIYYDMTDDEQSRVIGSVLDWVSLST